MEILTLRATFTSESKGTLPDYLGSTLRGVLGHCMRSFVCEYPGLRCHLCRLAADCTYAQNFCSPGNEAGAVNPFVLRSLTRGKSEWNPGDHCELELTLIGQTVRQAGLFLDALQEMGRKGWGVSRLPFHLEQVTDPVSQTLVWNRGRTWIRNCKARPLRCEQRPAGTVVVRFDTPVRFMKSGKLCHSLSFSDLIRSISRRITLLSHAYTDERLSWNEEAMLEAADRVVTAEAAWRDVDFSRYSMTRGGKLELAAIEGWARYEGDLTPFTPLLAAGEILHAGKNATIGFGHFQVSYDRQIL